MHTILITESNNPKAEEQVEADPEELEGHRVH